MIKHSPLLLAFVSVAAACGGDDGGASIDAPAAVKGPGAALKCQSSATGANAFDTYGAPAFVAVNEEIFRLVGVESAANGTTNLGDSFTKIGSGTPAATHDDLAAFKGELAAFLVFAYGGPASITYTDGVMYTANADMVTAHTGLNITAAQFAYFVTNQIVPALINKGVKHGAGTAADPDDVGTCFAPTITSAAFKASIVGH